ncbi:LysR family transcriptional regulator [Amaricoccus sp.]|uniref:LysR family transcriptional regulator n=1 Tax=Amaricoccus sp. TaxID=1872485 RepID=UPI002631643F|nr:LysR family transcriptional regulator [Amaricoccus sp.]HRO13055.1 LysR family transcriptional regulator [Amaricoccus sp.]
MRRTPSLFDLDLRLLRVFQMVVRHNGFSAAQDALGMTQATISSHMKLLEQRLGVRLCERGRSGFFLTDAGKRVHSAMLDLFGSIESFQGSVAAERGELSGVLHFGTVDAMHTNPAIDLAAALADFQRAAPRVRLEIDIAAPQTLAQGLLSGRYHVVLCPSQRYPAHMQATDLFDEEQRLYCGRGHPLFDADDDAVTPESLAGYPFAGRSYMTEEPICGVDFHWTAVTAHMEGTALLIVGGAYLSFLPTHFARQWVAEGAMRAMAPDRFTFLDRFQVVRPRRERVPAVAVLAGCLTGRVRGGAS